MKKERIQKILRDVFRVLPIILLMLLGIGIIIFIFYTFIAPSDLWHYLDVMKERIIRSREYLN